mmetsp:Transcript_27895/g.47733  ORF Transcript_27895/g.47733 Transcript_27895/m.47733 type:complete len:139 (+) Transcript_27895:63-479(+)
MRVILALPDGCTTDYTVDSDCTLSQLRDVLHEHEGIPGEMQNYLALSTAKGGDWESYPLTELFSEDFDVENDSMNLKLMLGPMDGGVGECNCCFCGCSCFHQGTCFAYICGIGCGLVQDYSRISCQLCCFHGKCCSVM